MMNGMVINKEEVVETIREHYKDLESHASDCIRCGACMKRCPFEVDIISSLKKAKELFKY